MAQNGTRATGPCIALVAHSRAARPRCSKRSSPAPARSSAKAPSMREHRSATPARRRYHKMSVEVSVATTNFMATAIPSSIVPAPSNSRSRCARGAARGRCRGRGASSTRKRYLSFRLILRELEEQKIPRFLFLNKIDKADATIHDVLTVLCSRPRAKLRCGRYRPFPADHYPASSISHSNVRSVSQEHALRKSCRSKRDVLDREKTARFSMLETLADARRRADGAVARGHPAAARLEGVRRSVQGLRDSPRSSRAVRLGHTAPTACCA